MIFVSHLDGRRARSSSSGWACMRTRDRTASSSARPFLIRSSSASISQTTTLGFRGYAGSAGILIRPSRNIGFAISGRKGQKIEARSDATAVSEANVPDRVGFAIAYEGIPGSSISVHAAQGYVVEHEWISALLQRLQSMPGKVDSAWSHSARALLRDRLCCDWERVIARCHFSQPDEKVKELSFAGGIGAQFFRNRATFDMTLRARDDAQPMQRHSCDAKERAYILSFGLRVRP